MDSNDDRLDNHPVKREHDRIERCVELVQSGETEAYRQLVEHFQYPMYRYAYHLLRSREEAEDAAQDILIRAYQSIGSYSRQVSFSAWLYKIGYRHCLNIIRKQKRMRLFQSLYRHEITSAPADHDEHIRIDDLLQGLKAEEKQIMLLRVAQDMSFDEIGSIIDCKPATVRKKFERIRAKLKIELDLEEEIDNGKPWPNIQT